MNVTLATGAGAVLFAATFLFGGHVHPLRAVVRDRRSIVSFCAGMAAAYVFVHLMPELNSARGAFAESVSVPLRYEGMAIYYLALVGFLIFYGLEVLQGYLKETVEEEGKAGLAFKLHVGGFAAYVWVMAYLLVRNLDEARFSIALYVVAIGSHFLALDHSLREEHGKAYERIGRPLLAGMCLLGWGVGLLLPLPKYALALLVALISGAIIMNSTIMEMPSEKDGRFMPFMVGGLVYGLMLLPLG